MTEPAAWVAGAPAPLAGAVASAAALLGASRAPVIAGLTTDAAGATAAAALARAIGGSLDHAGAAAGLRDLDVMRRAGWIVTTPLQARARADVVLLAGDGIAAAWPGMAAALSLDGPPTLTPDAPPRRMLRLGDEAGSLLATIAAVRALVGGRVPRLDPAVATSLRNCAAALLGARYAVVVWTAEAACDLAIEMICGLIDDLNRTTRCAGLPIAAGGNEVGVAAALAATTGFPARTGFGRGTPEHDPWRFDAARLVASGETDAVLWIAALPTDPPDWTRDMPTVALASANAIARWPTPPAVAIEVGHPGMDHAAILHDAALGTIAACPARQPSARPSVAAVLDMIQAALPAPARPC